MQCRSHSRRRTIECLFVTACSMDRYAEEKRTEKNLIVRSGISEAETTDNKRLSSTFCIEAIQTRSIKRPLCDSRVSCLPTPPAFDAPVRGVPIRISPPPPFGMEKLEWCGYCVVKKNCDDMFIRFDMIHKRDGRTDRRTLGRTLGQTPHDGTGRAYA